MSYEEPYRNRRRRRRKPRRRRSFGGWLAEGLLKLLALAVAVLLLAAGALYALPVSFFAVEPEGVELSLTDGLPTDRAHILLLGLDMARENSQRSDTVIVASIGYGKLQLTSVMRDTMVQIPGYGSEKLNAAYAHGGAQLVMRTLNENLKLNILHYVAVDFTALVNVVDALGGVDLDITEREMERINRNMEAARAKFEAMGYSAAPLTQSGERTHLNGVQALYYARIRKLDSDFRRTDRQRRLLRAMQAKIRANLWNPVMLYRLGKAALGSVRTNMSVAQLLSLGAKALADPEPGTMQIPVDGTYTDDGSRPNVDDWRSNIEQFRRAAYGRTVF